MQPSGISSTPRDTTTSWGKTAQQESSGLTLLQRFILMQPTSSASLEIWVRPTILLQLWNTTCKVKAKRCCMWGTSLALTTTLSLMATSGTPSVDLLSGAMHTSLGYGLQETTKSSTIHPSVRWSPSRPTLTGTKCLSKLQGASPTCGTLSDGHRLT